MSIIDERIVSMVFDNSRFSNNVKSTQDSLDALDQSIDEYTRNSSDNFLNLSDGLSRMDVVFAGFYEKIGGYLADLTMKGIQFSKSLSIDQVTAGFSKYTAETLAVQTIVSNTNNTLEDTYKILGDILDYTDKTSYHYDSMTNTMAKFANQGVALDQAAVAVKGIANWAAISGAGIEKADITMNALIKSMASGSMQMREWRTISQVANMGTAQFKQTLIETAQAMAKQGKASKEWLKITAENFESDDGVFGKNKLITAEVMLEVLKQYGDETSELGQKALAAASEAKTFGEAIGAVKDAVSTGFGTSFRYLFGNYDEARKFWTMIQDMMLEVFTLGIEFRNTIFKTWHELGGYKDMVQGIADAWEGVKNVVAPIGNIIKDVFNIEPAEKYAKKLLGITSSFKDWASNFKSITEYLNPKEQISGKLLFKDSFKNEGKELPEIYNVISNIFSIIRNSKDMVLSFIKNLKPALTGVGEALKSVVSFVSKVTRFGATLAREAKNVDLFGRIARSVATIFNSLLQPALKFITGILEKLGVKFNGAANNGEKMRTVLDKIATGFEKVADFLVNKAIAPAVQFLSDAFKSLSEHLGPVGERLGKVKDAITDFFKGTGDEEKKSPLATFLEVLGKALDTAWKIIKTVGEKVFGWIKEFLNTITGGGGLSALLAGGGFAALAIAIKRIAEALDTGGQLYDLLWNITKVQIVKQLKEFATALLMLAAALLVISLIDTEKLFTSFAVLSGLIVELAAVLKQFTKLSFSRGQALKIAVAGAAMIELSEAVLILAAALKVIASIDSNKLLAATVVLEVLLGSLVGVAILLSKNVKEFAKGGAALIELALAVRILASSVKALANLSWEELGKGLLGTVALLAAVAGAALLMKETGLSAGTGLAIIEIAAALKILVGVVRSLGEMEWDVLKQGLESVIITLGALGLIMNLFPQQGMLSIGTGLILVAAGLKLMTKSIATLGGMSIEELFKGITSMALSLGVLAVALNVMKGTLKGSAALTVAAAAILLLATDLKILASIPILNLLGAILGLAAALAAIGIVLVAFTAFGPGMLVVAAAFAVLGVAVAALGVGLLAVSAGGAAAIKTLELLIVTVANLIPLLILKIGEGFVAILRVIASSGAEIVKAVAVILGSILEALIQVVPQFLELVGVTLIGILDVIIQTIPKAIEVVTTLILALLDAIVSLVPAMIDAGITIIVAFLEGIAQMVVAIVQAGIDMIVAILNGIAEAIRSSENVQKMLDAGKNILTAIWDGFVQALSWIWNQIKEKGGEFLKGFKEGLEEKLSLVAEFFKGLPKKIWEWIKDVWADIKEAGGNIVKGIKEGINEWWNNLGIVKWFKGKIGGLTNAAKEELDEHSPSRVFAEIGRYIDEGLIVGIDKYARKVNDATKDMAGGAVDTMKDSLKAFGDIDLEEMQDPVIKPVLDLSEIQNGANSINNLLSDNYSVKLSATSGLSGSNEDRNSEVFAPVINMTINGAQGQDVNALADAVSRRINQALQSRERVWV